MPRTLLGSKARSLGTSMLRLILITLVINIAKGDCGRIMRRAISACASGFGGSSPDHGGRSSLDIVRFFKRSITKIESTLSVTGQEGEEDIICHRQGSRRETVFTGRE